MTAFLWQGAIYTSASQMPFEGRVLLVERGLAEPFIPQETKPLGRDDGNASQEKLTDDLTEISGLGQSRKARLNRIGILTFRDLADADRDVIESLEGVTRTMATAWIAEAISITESS